MNGTVRMKPEDLRVWGNPECIVYNHGVASVAFTEQSVLFSRGTDRIPQTPGTPIDQRCDRRQMIAETNAFLDWALGEGQCLPRIPRRRVDQGGFAEVMRRPLARIVTTHWWRRALERVDF